MPKHRKPEGIGEKHPGSEYAADEVEFLKAMELLKRSRPFPTWSEVLRVLKGLGYRKVEPCPSPSTGEGPLSPSPSKGEGRGGGNGEHD